jgi:hypothetical protein
MPASTLQNLGVDWDERVLPSIGNEVLKAVVAQYNAEQLLTQRDKVGPARPCPAWHGRSDNREAPGLACKRMRLIMGGLDSFWQGLFAGLGAGQLRGRQHEAAVLCSFQAVLCSFQAAACPTWASSGGCKRAEACVAARTVLRTGQLVLFWLLHVRH